MRLLRNPRARRVVIRVLPEGVVAVTAPPWLSRAEVAEAVARNRPWIAQRLAEHRRRAARLPGRNGTLPYLGRRLRVIAQPGRRRPRLFLEEGVILVGEGNQAAAVERLYRRAARREVERLLWPLARKAGLAPKAVRIGGPRSRWGSCSSTGRLSFHWALLLGPEAVLRYVVCHELAHLRVPNHSPAFWRLVGELDPGYAAARRFLAAEGWRLRLADPLYGLPG